MFLVVLLLFAGAGAFAAEDKDSDAEKDKADAKAGKSQDIVAVFRLSGALTEEPGEDSFPFFGAPGVSLYEIVERMTKAADDEKVKAVVLIPETSMIGRAQAEELRAAIAYVRSKNKPVYVHADSLMTSQYVLACGATRVSVVPTGLILTPGLHGSSLHVRGLLDKIGVKPDFITEGAYKSAAELFMREQPSPQADEMMNWLMDSWYGTLKEQIASGRKVDSAKAQAWINGGLYTAEQAKKDGLIDAVEQRDDFEEQLRKEHGKDIVFDKRYGRKKQPELDLSSPFAFIKIWSELLQGPQKKKENKPSIGIVYVSGPIMEGRSSFSPMGASVGAFSDDIGSALEEAANDDSIKAVVLRVGNDFCGSIDPHCRDWRGIRESLNH